jgi:hypothetical protein
MNEPAFPNEGFNGWGSPFQGMTLRDYFAAKAMQAYLSSAGGASAPNDMVAREAYKTADEMLKAREA